MDSNEIDCSADIKQEILEEIKQEPDEANEVDNIRAAYARSVCDTKAPLQLRFEAWVLCKCNMPLPNLFTR